MTWIAKRPGVAVELIAKVFRRFSQSAAPLVEILSWSPRLLIAAALFEVFAPRNKKIARELKLIRLRVSFQVQCPWCVEMNSTDLKSANITEEELRFLSQGGPVPSSLLPREVNVIRMAGVMSQSPVRMPQDLAHALDQDFSRSEIVTMTWTAAQVNFFARLFQSWVRNP